MLTEDLQVGDKVIFPNWDKPQTITYFEGNIAFTDVIVQYAGENNQVTKDEYNCFIMKFGDGEYNKLATKV
ncbi:hypothetical protein N9937_00130 [bacterium]|nr:hypothetical protein [bacterium]